ncbi:MAG: hypothetical protein A2Y56_00085 [Candidatus Aminicenantes bacterium RBG_13_63_10]|nr:MAG: hypothetical protein A2Y56_00085 [Candidatus Aminicenantes bacterium RBG_13_63_10]
MNHWRRRLTAAAVCAGILFLPSLGESAAASAGRTDTEAVVDTPLPENTLSGVSLSGGWDDYRLFSPFTPAPSAGSPAVLPIRPSFWRTAENSLFAGTLVSFAALNVADYLLVRERLNYPELGEVNPILGPIVKNPWTFALYKIGTVALNSISLASLHRFDKPVGWAMSLVTNLLMALTVSSLSDELDTVRSR